MTSSVLNGLVWPGGQEVKNNSTYIPSASFEHSNIHTVQYHCTTLLNTTSALLNNIMKAGVSLLMERKKSDNSIPNKQVRSLSESEVQIVPTRKLKIVFSFFVRSITYLLLANTNPFLYYRTYTHTPHSHHCIYIIFNIVLLYQSVL